MTYEYRAHGAPPRRVEPLEPPTIKGGHKYRWVFHAPPVSAPGAPATPFIIPEPFADDLGRHLERLGFWSRDELVALADRDGGLDPHALPEPTVRHDPPPAGPVVWENPGPWVPVTAPEPAREVGPLDEVTDDELEAELARRREEGGVTP